MHRTPAQYAADRRRSHKARAKREQKFTALAYVTRRTMISNGWPAEAIGNYAEAMGTSARMARKHLNFLLSGKYEDFTQEGAVQ